MKNTINVIAFMNAYSKGKSGADKAFVEIFKRFKNIELSVVTSKLGEKFCKKEGLNANYLITSYETEFNHPILTYIRRIIKAIGFILKLSQYDVLYATSDSLPDILPGFILKYKNKKDRFIAKIFHVIPQERKISYLAQQVSFFLIKKLADVIIIDNELLKQELSLKGFSKDKLTVNYLGVDHEYYKSIIPSVKTYDATFMARLHESKGIFDLIQIWQRVVKKIPNATLAIIGSGNKTITKKITEYTSEVSKNIKLLGYIEDNEAFALIKSSKVFLFPSREEGFGLVIGEVMACGVPIVAYDLPIYENTFKKGMRTVPLGRIDLFSDATLDLLTDEKKRERMKKDALSFVKQFPWSSTVKKELRILLGQKSIGS